jgi:hypothetical protein
MLDRCHAKGSEPLGHSLTSLSHLTFGVHDQTWQGALLKEVKRRKQEQYQVLVFLCSQCVRLLVFAVCWPIFVGHLGAWYLDRSR